MTEPITRARPRPQPRSRAEYRWTGPKAAAFLRALAATGSVSKAARSVAMSRQSAYGLRGRMGMTHGPEFGRLWDEALAMAMARRFTELVDAVRADRKQAGATPAMTPAMTPATPFGRAK